MIRRIFSFPVVCAGFLLSTVYALAHKGVSDPDIWFHLLNAEYLVTTHRVPRVEIYSFTAGGLPWMNPEVLAELPYYFAWKAYGLLGIKVLSLLLLELIFVGLLYLCWKESHNIKASAIACYFAAFLATISFGPRTILFGYLYMIVLLLVLQRMRLKGRAPLWLLPPLFCLWVNTHGSWSLGIIVFGLTIAAGLVHGKVGRVEATRWSPRQLRNLIVTMATSIALLFVNPYGYHLVFWPVDVATRQKEAIAHIEEWVSVDFHTVRGKIVLVLLLALLLSALLSRYQWKLQDLVFVLFGLYMGMTYIRFLILTGILVAPFLAKLLDFVPPYRREIDKPVLNAILLAGMVVFMVHGFPTKAELQESVDRDYPAEILPYFEAHPPTGHVLNSWLWGSYLCWHDRSFKDFIDSREDVFVYAGVFKDYIDLLGLKDTRRTFDKYDIKYVLFESHAPVTRFLRANPDWKVLFEGKVCVLFERVGPNTPQGAGIPVPTGRQKQEGLAGTDKSQKSAKSFPHAGIELAGRRVARTIEPAINTPPLTGVRAKAKFERNVLERIRDVI